MFSHSVCVPYPLFFETKLYAFFVTRGRVHCVDPSALSFAHPGLLNSSVGISRVTSPYLALISNQLPFTKFSLKEQRPHFCGEERKIIDHESEEKVRQRILCLNRREMKQRMESFRRVEFDHRGDI